MRSHLSPGLQGHQLSPRLLGLLRAWAVRPGPRGAPCGVGSPRHLSAQGGAQAVVESQDAVGTHHLQRHAHHALLHLLLRLQVHLLGEASRLLRVALPGQSAACASAPQ